MPLLEAFVIDVAIAVLVTSVSVALRAMATARRVRIQIRELERLVDDIERRALARAALGEHGLVGALRRDLGLPPAEEEAIDARCYCSNCEAFRRREGLA